MFLNLGNNRLNSREHTQCTMHDPYREHLFFSNGGDCLQGLEKRVRLLRELLSNKIDSPFCDARNSIYK